MNHVEDFLEFVLIETLWNVNVHTSAYLYRLCSVLIETLWNVNIMLTIPQLICTRVLIETLWNVNTESVFRVVEVVSCINRNIVECK